MFPSPLNLSKPGLFITATDTGVGKTVVTCGIIRSLKQGGYRVGVCKPFASGCELTPEGLVSEDTQALTQVTDFSQSIEVINPIRYVTPLAPAAAAQQEGCSPDYNRLVYSLNTIDSTNDAVLVEGVGGLLVPLDDNHTVLDLIKVLRYPVVVVTRNSLGTLNHTAMTVRILRDAGCRVLGLIVNEYSASLDGRSDPSVTSNGHWLEHMNETPILATIPLCPSSTVVPHKKLIPKAILDAIDDVYWPGLLGLPQG